MLAERAGVKLERFSEKNTDKKQRLYALLEAATFFLERNLTGEDLPTGQAGIPLQYLKKRGLSDKIIKEWRIGYVRDEWRSISDYLSKKGFTESEMERAGITKTEGKNTYDRFRGRIMFPIFDAAGRVIAFSGRILNDDGKSAKYLNSPQTEIFDKSKVLYGYHAAKQAIRKFDFSILVEGQMDLLLAHQAGFENTVACSGTALTAEHLHLLKRISNKIIMTFDGDEAGAKAAERGWALALSLGMDVKIAELEKGIDPADLILKNKEEFKNVLKNSVHLVDFLLNRIMAKHADQRKLGLELKNKVLPYVKLLESNIERSFYVSKISEKTGIKEEAIWEDLKNIKLDEEFQPKESGENKAIERQIDSEILKKGSVERSLASILSKEEGRKNANADILKKEIENIIGEERYGKFEKERKSISGELAFEAEGYYGNFPELKMGKEIDYLILNLREENYKRELNGLLTDLKKSEKNREIEKIKAISVRLKEIMEKLSKIKQDKNKIL